MKSTASITILNRILTGLMLIGICFLSYSDTVPVDTVHKDPLMVSIDYQPIRSMSSMIDRLNFKFELLDTELQELWYQADLFEMDYDTLSSNHLYNLADQLERHRDFLIERMR